MRSLEALVEAKVRLSSKTPKLNWQFLINRFKEHEIERAREMAKAAAAEIYFLLMDVWGNEDWISSYHKDAAKFAGLSDVHSSSAGELDGVERAQIVEHARQQDMPDYAIAHVDNIQTHSHFPCWCSQVFHTMAINTDGSVNPCTEIADSRFNLGNLLSSDIDDLWNGKMFKRSRKYIMHKEVNGSLCESCVRGESACAK